VLGGDCQNTPRSVIGLRHVQAQNTEHDSADDERSRDQRQHGELRAGHGFAAPGAGRRRRDCLHELASTMRLAQTWSRRSGSSRSWELMPKT
jgi:hypothetical protein